MSSLLEDQGEGFQKVRIANDKTPALICERAQMVIIKLLDVRKEVHTSMKLFEFKQVWSTTSKFVDFGTSQVCFQKRDLIHALQDQASMLVDKRDQLNKTALLTLLENEGWEAAEVPYEYQDAIERITTQTLLSRTYQHPLQEQSASNSDSGLRLNQRLYKVPFCTLMCVKYLEAYLLLGLELPSVAQQATSRMVALISHFCKKTERLLLFAEGASASSALGKVIKAKHLAIALESVLLLSSCRLPWASV